MTFMRKTIIQEMPVNPAYYEKMSVLLLTLIQLRKEGAITYEELLKKYEELAKEIQPNTRKVYPKAIDSKTKQALYDNLNSNEEISIAMDEEIRYQKDDDWRSTHIKRKKVEIAIKKVLERYSIMDEETIRRIYDLVNNQNDY